MLDAGEPFWRHIPGIEPVHHDVAPPPKRARSVRADVDQQTSDATPLAEERVGQPLHTIHWPSEEADALLDRLTFEAESDAQSEAADSMLQQLDGFPALLEIRTVSYTHLRAHET